MRVNTVGGRHAPQAGGPLRIVTHGACVPGRLARGGGAALGGSALRAARCGKCIEASRRGWTVGAGASGPARRGQWPVPLSAPKAQRVEGSASGPARRGQRVAGSTSRAASRAGASGPARRGQRIKGSASRAALRAARRGQRIQGSTSRAADRGQRIEGSASRAARRLGRHAPRPQRGIPTCG